MDMDFAVSRPLVRPGLPRIRFLFVRSRLCSTLPSDPASRRRPCASLALHLHQVVQGTCTPRLSNMLGTRLNRFAVGQRLRPWSLRGLHVRGLSPLPCPPRLAPPAARPHRPASSPGCAARSWRRRTDVPSARPIEKGAGHDPAAPPHDRGPDPPQPRPQDHPRLHRLRRRLRPPLPRPARPASGPSTSAPTCSTCVQERQVSWDVYRQARLALRFFYNVTLGREWVVAKVARPKVPKKLPVVLSRTRWPASSTRWRTPSTAPCS